MARPEKQWLDYFSMDVEKDNKIKFLKAKFWLIWYAMYIELLQFIYKEWYYIEFTDDNMLLFMSETGLKEEETKLMLEFMLLKDLFNKPLFEKYNILTSNWIQKRYAEWTKKRKRVQVETVLWCVWEYDHIELKDTLTELKDTLTPEKSPISTQSKVKESKVKEKKNSFNNVEDYYTNLVEDWYIDKCMPWVDHDRIKTRIEDMLFIIKEKKYKLPEIPKIHFKNWNTNKETKELEYRKGKDSLSEVDMIELFKKIGRQKFQDIYWQEKAAEINKKINLLPWT